MLMSDDRSHDPQPAPTAGDGRDVMAELARMVEERRSFGLRKYGRCLEAHNSRDVLKDILDELIDASAYTLQLIMERDGGHT
jgi:hypothetical protein